MTNIKKRIIYESLLFGNRDSNLPNLYLSYEDGKLQFKEDIPVVGKSFTIDVRHFERISEFLDKIPNL